MEEGQLQRMTRFNGDSLKEPEVEEARRRLMPDGMMLYPTNLSVIGLRNSVSEVSSLPCCQQTIVKIH